MDDLTRCLYAFVCAKRMGSLSEDEEYQEYIHTVKSQKARVMGYLNEEQQMELNLLIDHITAQDGKENEHIFQAALALSRELNGLVS